MSSFYLILFQQRLGLLSPQHPHQIFELKIGSNYGRNRIFIVRFAREDMRGIPYSSFHSLFDYEGPTARCI
jgi:hypothetical protein